MSAVSATTTTTSWAGRLLSAFAVLFLLFDGAIKLLALPPAVEATTGLGYPASTVRGLGALALVCLAFYVVPRSSALGAVLLTGYLGGAVATHVQNGSPVFSVLFPALLGLFVWGGLFLRDGRVRALVPLRR